MTMHPNIQDEDENEQTDPAVDPLLNDESPATADVEELSDGALDQVAGGTKCPFTCWAVTNI
jgi:hypothetical protein